MKKILLIDDMPDTVELMRRILSAGEYEFVSAPDAETGLQTALETQPDLILLDLGLPDYDGLTVISWFQEEESLKAIPVIAFTAWPQEALEKMVVSYGFKGYISKPVKSVREFLGYINTFLP